jgi:hypothetical protein
MQQAVLNRASMRVADTTEVSGRVTADEENLDRFHNRIRKVCALVAAAAMGPALAAALPIPRAAWSLWSLGALAECLAALIIRPAALALWPSGALRKWLAALIRLHPRTCHSSCNSGIRLNIALVSAAQEPLLWISAKRSFMSCLISGIAHTKR